MQLCPDLDPHLDLRPCVQVLAKRQEDASDVAAGLRADMAEGRRRIREIDEGVRESKKRKREEELAVAQVGEGGERGAAGGSRSRTDGR